MSKISYLVIAALAFLVIGALCVGCQSCYRATSAVGSLRSCKEVPPPIADAKLLSYEYSRHGDMRFPLHSEKVEICKDDSSHCIIKVFDLSRNDLENVDANGDPLPDSLVVSSAVLDTVKQMLVDAKVWRFKEDYSNRANSMDGESWKYSAVFSVTDSLLAATPETERTALQRRGLKLTSGGSGASPETDIFEKIRLYLESVSKRD